jgi:adenylyltransferase/sulfurtransferase
VQDYKRKLDAGEKPFLLDVREPYEYEISKIEGSTLIPLGEVGSRLNELVPHKEEEIVVQCRSGARSQTAALQLKEAGFKHVVNLVGGINAWATEIDPSLPTY